MKLENQNILITSNEPWSDVWFSKHNYAWELAKKNIVFFINSPGKWKFSNLFSGKIGNTKITNSLFVITIQNTFPSNLKVLKELNNLIISLRLKRYLKNYGLNDWMLWSFTPLFLFRPKLLKCKFTIFHIMDMNWTDFYGAKLLAKFADRLVLVSEFILAEYEFCSVKKIVVEHGISEEEFHFDEIKSGNIKSEIKNYGYYGLYVGVIDRRCDFALIEKMVNTFKTIAFIFIGPINISSDHPYNYLFNGNTKNIITLGKKPYKDLKYYIKQSWFCLSPMDLNYSGNELSHHKTLTYLAQGKPVFGPHFKAYSNIADLMYSGDNHKHIIEKMSDFINKGENDNLIADRIDYAKLFLYSKHLKKIEAFIDK